MFTGFVHTMLLIEMLYILNIPTVNLVIIEGFRFAKPSIITKFTVGIFSIQSISINNMVCTKPVITIHSDACEYVVGG